MRISTPFCSKSGVKSASVSGAPRTATGVFLGLYPRNLSTPRLTANRSLRDSSCSHASLPENVKAVPETGSFTQLVIDLRARHPVPNEQKTTAMSRWLWPARKAWRAAWPSVFLSPPGQGCPRWKWMVSFVPASGCPSPGTALRQSRPAPTSQLPAHAAEPEKDSKSKEPQRHALGALRKTAPPVYPRGNGETCEQESAGDVKLCAGIGAWVGPGQMLIALIFIALASGVMPHRSL